MNYTSFNRAILDRLLHQHQPFIDSSEPVIDMVEVRIKESGKIVWVSPDDYRAHWDAYTRCAHPDSK